MVKSLLLSMFLAIVGLAAIAQVPAAFNYQAVVRNASGEILENQNVSFQISILENAVDGSASYVETHSATTNDFGLITLQIGNGTLVSGDFNPAGWGSANHSLKVEFDAEGGSSYSLLGTTQLLAVPYALHALTVEKDSVNDADADASNELQTISLSGTQLTLSNGGGTVTLPSSGGGDNWGTQTVETDATLTGNGTSASPLSVDGDLTDNQMLSINGSNLSIEDGNTVNLSAINTDNQTLALSGSDLTISNGNTVTLPSGSVWEETNGNIHYSGGKVAVGKNPGTDLRQFQVLTTENYQAIAAENNANYPTIYAENKGAGPAAEFKNRIRIQDDTQGAGKVLTSDANGNSSWQTQAWQRNYADEPYSLNAVGIGIIDPQGAELVVHDDTGAAAIRLSSAANNTMFTIQKNKNTDFCYTNYRSSDSNGFYTGLMASLNYRIATSTASELNGLEVEEDGDVNISDELHTSKTGEANMLPIAYGTIFKDGTIKTSSGNITVSKTSTGVFSIHITGEAYYYLDYVCNATLTGVGFIQATSGSNNLLINTMNTSATKEDMSFHFVVYKP